MTLTKNVWAATLAVLTTLAVVAVLLFVPTNSANAAPGSSPSDPIVVTNVADVPEGAVEDKPSTYNTPSQCDTTRSWVKTVAATDDVTHQEWTAEKSKRTKTVVETPVYVTEYHFRKFTQTRERTYAPGTPAVMSDGLWLNFSPNKDQKKFEGPPAYPTDPRGTWQHYGDGKDIPPGHAGPDGVYQNGNGNGSWFYREAPKVITPATEGSWGPWGPWSAWTPWEPETHTSWETSPAPLGTPQPHGSGQTGNTQWERQWQAQHDGETRQTQTGTTTETVYGEWSDWKPYGNNPYLSEPSVPEDTDTKRYRVSGPVTVKDSDGTPEQVTYYAWTDGKVCETVTETPSETPTTPVVTPTETVTVTPPVVTETPVVPTETVTETPEPEPTKTPTPDKDKPEPKPEPDEPVYLIECVNGVFVTTVDGEVVSENGSCVERDENDEPVTFNETGL